MCASAASFLSKLWAWHILPTWNGLNCRCCDKDWRRKCPSDLVVRHGFSSSVLTAEFRDEDGFRSVGCQRLSTQEGSCATIAARSALDARSAGCKEEAGNIKGKGTSRCGKRAKGNCASRAECRTTWREIAEPSTRRVREERETNCFVNFDGTRVSIRA